MSAKKRCKSYEESESIEQINTIDSVELFDDDISLPMKEKNQLIQLRGEMESDIPSIEKIMLSNITKNDKKICLRLYDQFEACENQTAEYYRLIDSINEILLKSNFYTKDEIDFLENEEEKLKKFFTTTDTLKTKILKLEADDNIKSRILSMYEEMLTYPPDSSTYSSLREEIEWSIRLPYEKRQIDDYISMNNESLNNFYCEVRKKLDENLYGMDKVKNRIIHILNDRRSSGDSCGRNIVLCGDPGVGKTAICKTLAKIFQKKFAKISASSLDSAAIKGSNKVYVGSEPSIILQILATLKTNNALIMIDEVDKVDLKCQHALLHVSDTSDNKEFQDNYLKNFSHDLSKVMFIYNLNKIDSLDPALLDRFDIIYVDNYTLEEQVEIFKNYMLPKALLNLGMNTNDVIISRNTIKKLLEQTPRSLRSIERLIKDMISKINMYKNITLSDGGIGEMKLNYKIRNFKIPLKIDYNLLVELTM